MIRFAALYNDKNIYAEFSSEKFKKLLTKYVAKYKSVEIALNKIEEDLKKEIIHK